MAVPDRDRVPRVPIRLHPHRTGPSERVSDLERALVSGNHDGRAVVPNVRKAAPVRPQKGKRYEQSVSPRLSNDTEAPPRSSRRIDSFVWFDITTHPQTVPVIEVGDGGRTARDGRSVESYNPTFVTEGRFVDRRSGRNRDSRVRRPVGLESFMMEKRGSLRSTMGHVESRPDRCEGVRRVFGSGNVPGRETSSRH